MKDVLSSKTLYSRTHFVKEPWNETSRNKVQSNLSVWTPL